MSPSCGTTEGTCVWCHAFNGRQSCKCVTLYSSRHWFGCTGGWYPDQSLFFTRNPYTFSNSTLGENLSYPNMPGRKALVSNSFTSLASWSAGPSSSYCHVLQWDTPLGRATEHGDEIWVVKRVTCDLLLGRWKEKQPCREAFQNQKKHDTCALLETTNHEAVAFLRVLTCVIDRLFGRNSFP
eukprot:scaffold6420_cov168-Amphora_coffeaeformis.AAC.2